MNPSGAWFAPMNLIDMGYAFENFDSSKAVENYVTNSTSSMGVITETGAPVAYDYSSITVEDEIAAGITMALTGSLIGKIMSITGATAGISTNYGTAYQSASDAKDLVESGAPLYRAGEFGVNETTEAQFWSLENPLTNPNYMKEYGLPNKGIEFIESAHLSEGTQFVTGEAASLGSNPGGTIEVIVERGGAVLDWFSTL